MYRNINAKLINFHVTYSLEFQDSNTDGWGGTQIFEGLCSIFCLKILPFEKTSSGRTDARAEAQTPILWPPDSKRL